MTKAKFATEAELCARFISGIGSKWVAYAETAGWDILLARKSDGFQIGIQAKLRFNAHVLSQAIESKYDTTRAGPDCRAVLVPLGSDGGLTEIARYVGITVITTDDAKGRARSWPYLPDEKYGLTDEWFEQCPVKRHKLPDYVPDVPAGARAPVQLTTWKISAIKIAITLETRGFVTREDFKAHGIDHRRWVPQGWLVSQSGQMKPGPALPNFKGQHPKVYEQIKAPATA